MNNEKNEKLEKILQGLGQENVPEDIKQLAEDTSQNFSDGLTGLRHNIQWGNIMRTNVIKIAAAAIIIIAIAVSTKLGISDKTPETNIAKQTKTTNQELAVIAQVEQNDKIELAAALKAELKNLEQMFAAGDVRGLIGMLETGQLETKLAAANYLAQIGDSNAIITLEAAAEQWEGDATENPFTAAAEDIKTQNATEQETTLAKSDSSIETTEDSNKKDTGFSYRKPDYSLLEEPLRVKPVTLDNPSPSPQQAIVLAKPIRWWASHWGAKGNTSLVAFERHKNFDRFIVNETGMRKAWVKYFDIPIDAQLYPILVMTYRCKGTSTESDRYSLYLDDDSGPSYGGLEMFMQKELIPDGQEHVIACDLRPLEPFSDLIGMAIGTHNDETGSAEFDLIDLRFEAEPNSEPLEKLWEDFEVKVAVVDANDMPIEGAAVTVDAERHNWARTALTDSQGQVSIKPYYTISFRHMARVTAPGMIPVEIRDMPDLEKTYTAVLEPATIYRGTVVDELGNPLPHVTVDIKANYSHPQELWTRKDAIIQTDQNGRWESPTLPQNAQDVRISLAHPDYTKGPNYSAAYKFSVDELQSGEAVLSIKQDMLTAAGTITDSQGKPLAKVKVASLSNLNRAAETDSQGQFTIEISESNDILIVAHDNYAADLIDLSNSGNIRDLKVILKPGKLLHIKVVDPKGNPMSRAVIQAVEWRGIPLFNISSQTDGKGEYKYPSAPADAVTWKVYQKGYETATESITADGSIHTITLIPDSNLPEPNDTGNDPNDPRGPNYDPFEMFRRAS